MAEQNDKLEEWQQYPVFQELMTDYDKYVDLRNKCANTCRELDRVLKNGSSEEKEAAQKSINAYGYALGLLDEAIQARDRIVEEHG